MAQVAPFYFLKREEKEMSTAELFIIAIGLSMDAFAVAICKGVCLKKATLRQCSIVGGYFGLFQAGMPVIGYFLGIGFADKIVRFDHWIAFVLLGVIGGKMFFESFKKEKTDCPLEANDKAELKFTKMVVLAIATSIDALAAGVSFAFLEVEIFFAVVFIGAITFALSAIGAFVGYKTGSRFKTRAQIAGAVILILLGVKMLVEQFL